MMITFNKEQKEFVISFLKTIRLKQEQLPNNLVYCPIKLYSSIQFDIKNIGFLCHPLVVKVVNFWDDYKILDKKEDLIDLMEQVIVHETSENLKECSLSSEELKDLISKFRQLKTPNSIGYPTVKALIELS